MDKLDRLHRWIGYNLLRPAFWQTGRTPKSRRMKRAITNIGIAVVFFVLGVASVYLLKRERAYSWIAVVSDGGGFGMSSEALNGDIPWPGTTKPSGRVNFSQPR